MTIALASLALLVAQDASPTPDKPLTVADGHVEIRLDGAPFTTLRWEGLSRPVLWPVLDRAGRALTRAWPMTDATAEAKGDATDHVHQRSLWFAHGDVNGVDFWTEGDKAGRIEVKVIERTAMAADRVALRLHCDWVGPDDKVVCTEVRDLLFAVRDGARTIDFGIALRASHGALRFGDTKEGTMAVRVAQGLCFDQEGGKGRALSSEGLRDKDVWGTRARWVAFHGEVDGATAGIALLDHKDNLRHPTTWHARPYGLLAANPFGLHDFEKAPPGSGELKLDADATLALRYRVVVFVGAADSVALDEQWEQLVTEPAAKEIKR